MKGAPFLALSLREVGPGQRIQSMIRLRPVPRRVGPQQRVIARQLSGLSVSRTQLLLLQESFEHSIWGPFGVKLMADQGRVALTRSDLGFSDLRQSYAAGSSLRA